MKARGRKPRKKKSPGPTGCAKGQLPVHGKHLQAKNSQRRNGIRRLNGCRQKQVQRNKSNKLCIGTWNVKTLLKPGKMQELAEELVKTQLEIVAEDNITQDICQMKIKNWIACVQDRGKWKEVVERAKTFN